MTLECHLASLSLNLTIHQMQRLRSLLMDAPWEQCEMVHLKGLAQCLVHIRSPIPCSLLHDYYIVMGLRELPHRARENTCAPNLQTPYT